MHWNLLLQGISFTFCGRTQIRDWSIFWVLLQNVYFPRGLATVFRKYAISSKTVSRTCSQIHCIMNCPTFLLLRYIHYIVFLYIFHFAPTQKKVWVGGGCRSRVQFLSHAGRHWQYMCFLSQISPYMHPQFSLSAFCHLEGFPQPLLVFLFLWKQSFLLIL